jgi:hypothetical protein
MWDIVTGTVTRSDTGEPLAGIRVVAMDKDLVLDDALGEAITDARGRYKIEYDPASFGSPLERAPDVYLQVFDEEGRLLASSKGTVVVNAPSLLTIDVTLPAEK